MSRVRLVAAIAAASLLVGCGFLKSLFELPPDMSGEWVGVIDRSPGSDGIAHYNLHQVGDSVTGSGTHRYTDSWAKWLVRGKLDDSSNIAFHCDLESSGGVSHCWSDPYTLTCVLLHPTDSPEQDTLKSRWRTGDQGAITMTHRSDAASGAQVYYPNLTGFGRYTATLKSTRGSGVIIAFFLYANDHNEIDVELFGTAGARYVAYANHGPVHSTSACRELPFAADGGYHDYAIDWRTDTVEFFVDGELDTFFTTDVPQDPCRVMFNVWLVRDTQSWYPPLDVPGDPAAFASCLPVQVESFSHEGENSWTEPFDNLTAWCNEPAPPIEGGQSEFHPRNATVSDGILSLALTRTLDW